MPGPADGADENQWGHSLPIEQSLTLKTDNLMSAVFLIATNYVFNMDYHTKAKDFLTFIASKVAGILVSGYK